MKRIFRLSSVTLLMFAVSIYACLSFAYAETVIIGKVVGISDGDTITVLQDRAQYKIRLYGIDCPESHQDFGTKAKQFVSDLVFGKTVKVIQKQIDQYGRTVGIVYIGELCVNQEIIRSGFAWVYKQYCRDSICHDWHKLEKQARVNQAGLWNQSNPIPPWEFRKGNRRALPKTDKTSMKNEAMVYHGNTRSTVFHQPACQHFNCKNCTVVFQSRVEAIEAGYRPCGGCRP